MQRIEDFLKEDEVPDWACTLSTPVSGNTNGNGASYKQSLDSIGFSDASFEWIEPSTTGAAPACFQLGPLDVSFPPGKLNIISGATGSGKSALLAALLGGGFLSKFNYPKRVE